MKRLDLLRLTASLCGLIATTHFAAAQGQVVFIPAQSSWRYLDNGSDPITPDWLQTGFNDAAWSSGPARLGFGGDGEQTVLQSGHFTYHFRRKFTWPFPPPGGNLQVRLKRDDGAIVYLNGTEVFRSNMPTGRVDYLTPAASAVSIPDETNVFLSPVFTSSILRPGENVVAVEVHQASLASSDIGFDLELLGNDLAATNRVVINEWLASNTSGLRDEDGDASDWIELFNTHTSPLDLSGAYLSDNLANPTLWQIPTGTIIPARGYWFVFASAKNRTRHTNFRLGNSGETIQLHARDGATLIDSVSFGPQTPDISQGRCPDGGAAIQFMSPTPGAPNNCGPPSGVFIEGCWGFAEGPFGPVPNPWTTDGLTLTAFQADGILEPNGSIDAAGTTWPNLAYSGYRIGYKGELRFDIPCRSVSLEYFETSGLVDFVAFDDAGGEVVRQQRLGATSAPETRELTSTGNLIRRVVITSPNHLVRLRRVCCRADEERACTEFTGLTHHFPLLPNPFVQAGISFQSLTLSGVPLAFSVVRELGGEAGLQVGQRTEIILPSPCERMELAFRGVTSPLTIESFDRDGSPLETRTVMLNPTPATVVPLGGGVQRIMLTRADTNAILTRICCLGGAASPTHAIGSFTPLGNTDLSVSSLGDLMISNTSPSLPGGIGVLLGNEAGVGVRFASDLAADAMPAGAIFGVILRGLNGEHIGGLAGVQNGGAFDVSADFAAIGSPTYAACLYADNRMVGSVTGQALPFVVKAMPAAISVQRDNAGQIRLTLDYDTPAQFGFAGLPAMFGTRLDLVTERRANTALTLTRMDLIWSGAPVRPLRPSGQDCLSILSPDVIVTCAEEYGARVFYNVVATNSCTHSTQPASCVPRSDTIFRVGETRVTCVAGSASQPVFSSFRVIVTRSESGNLIENPSFERATPIAPAGGRPFAGVTGWTMGPGSADLFGPGGFVACDGTNYAGLSAQRFNGVFVGGTNEGRLTHPLTIRGQYDFQVCLGLVRGRGAWIEFVLSDGNPLHEQIIAREFPEIGGGWQPLILSHHFSPALDASAGARFTARYAHDRIIVRTREALDGRISDGYVRVDHLRLGCFAGLMTGSTAPRSLTLHWVGDGVLQSSSALGQNAKWADTIAPISHDGNIHQAVIPTDGNRPMQFFRLRSP